MKKKIIYALLILLLVFTGGVFANIITLPIGLDVMKKGGEDSVLNADIVFNTTGETHQSSPLTLKEFGDPLSNEEYNRLLEALALNPSAYTVGEWTTGSWGSCSVSCGGGTQTRSVTCTYDSCTGSEPPSSQSCNTQSCATCSDGIQNQNETGVDCGGVCGACAVSSGYCEVWIGLYTAGEECYTDTDTQLCSSTFCTIDVDLYGPNEGINTACSVGVEQYCQSLGYTSSTMHCDTGAYSGPTFYSDNGGDRLSWSCN